MRLQGKVGIITAAGSGMGRAGAVRFAEEGAAVAVVSLVEEEVAGVVEQIQRAGGRAIGLHGDLSTEEFSREIVDRTVAEFGKLNFLWNHVGFPGPASIEDLDLREFDQTINLNIRTVLATTSQALPHLRAQGGGSVLFTASTSGIVGSPWSPIYSSAKFGVVGLARSLARKYGVENIRFNAICPGTVDTPMLRVFVARPDDERFVGQDKEKLTAESAQSNALKRLGQPEEIANAALFLTSDEASFITGAAIPVDGGVLA